ncbi:MAG: hypothetical protein ACRDXF_09030 [Acidimicrobiia bacterium]
MSSAQGYSYSSRRVMMALANFNGRKLLVSWGLIASYGMALLGTGMFVAAALTQDNVSFVDDGWTVAVGFYIFAMFTMVATNHAALRDRREGTSEQHESLPADSSVRAGGVVLATAWPLAVAAVLLGVVAAATAVWLVVPSGVQLVALIQTVVFVATLGTLGVALAAWVPNSFVAPVVAFALFIVQTPEPPASWHVIFPLAHLGSVYLAAWHTIYLIGLTLVFAGIALARSGIRRPVVACLLVGSAAVGISLAVMITQVCSGSTCLF